MAAATTTVTEAINNNLASGKSSTTLRTVEKVMARPRPHWVGDGFFVYPVFDKLAFKEELSPFLMFDYAQPKQFSPRKSKPLGVGQHPHRGMETVTIAFQGEVEHADSTGQSGVIGPGDIQWMTAGRGIIHQEFHSNKFTKEGGTMEMCQLWVNLPKKDKMTAPRYQPILNEQVPVLPLAWNDGTGTGASARIIAGEIGTTKGPAKTYSPVQLWDIDLPEAGKELDLPIPSHHKMIVFVRRGSVEIIGGTNQKHSSLGPQTVALMTLDNNNTATDDGSMDTLRVRVQEPNSSILVMGGEPLREPIAAHGPFVMNEPHEIMEAFRDYSSGKMGR